MKSFTLILVWCALGTNLASQTPSLAEQYLYAAANADRAAHQLLPVQFDPLLAKAAAAHAGQMAAHETISHQFAGERDLAERAAAAGAHFSLVTENVAEATNPAVIHDLWMRSAGHRANLLDPQVTSVGISVLFHGGRSYAVQDFARAVPDLNLDQQEAGVARLLQRTGISVEPGSEDARATCRQSSGYTGPRRPFFTMRYTSADLLVLPAQLIERLASGKYRRAIVGACVATPANTPFSSYTVAVLLYP